MTELKKILVAVNFEEHEHQALDWAASLAEMSGAEVKVVNVVEAPGVGGDTVAELTAERQGALDAELARLSELGLKVSGDVLADAGHGPAGTLLRAAEGWGPDLLMVGSHPRTGLAKLFDTSAVSRKIVEGAPCAVLLAKKTD